MSSSDKSDSGNERDPISNGDLFRKKNEAKKKKKSDEKISIRNISLNPKRSSTLNSFIILLKYPLFGLLFTQSRVGPRVGFSSSESTSSLNKTKVASSAMLNFKMNETPKFECFHQTHFDDIANDKFDFIKTFEF